MADTTERARLIQYAEGIVHIAAYGPEMGWTHPEEEAQDKREAIEVVRALAAELAAAEKQNAELERRAETIAGLTGGMLAELRDEDPAGWGGWVKERVTVIHREAAAASEGKP